MFQGSSFLSYRWSASSLFTFFCRKSILFCLALVLTGCGEKAVTVSADSEAASDAAQKMLVDSASNGNGKALFAACTACHGANAEGNKVMNAPSLLMQDAWYLKAQMQKFRNGQRGGDKDVLGMQMAAIAKSLPNDAAVDTVVTYIDGLRSNPSKASLEGDIALGRDYYTNVCGSCHGPAAEGYKMFSAPALAGVNDWYLLRQFENFRSGIRGAHPDDKTGRQMVMMAPALPNKEIAQHVMAYIQTLAK
jgi:cytochrome c oxidase subunit 2